MHFLPFKGRVRVGMGLGAAQESAVQFGSRSGMRCCGQPRSAPLRASKIVQLVSARRLYCQFAAILGASSS